MAVTSTINVNVNTKQAQQSAKDLDKSIKGVGDRTHSLRTELRQMKEALLEMDEGSKEFQELAFNAAQLEDAIGDVSSRVRVLASDTLRLDQGVQITQGLVGAFGAVQGAVALLGVENEALMQTMVKLQGIQNITNGLTQVANMLNKDSAAGILLRDTRTKILNSSLFTQTTATAGATTATKTLNMAMRALPIVAIIGGIAALVSSLVSFNKEQEKSRIEAEKWAEAQKKAKEKSDEQNKSIAEQSGKFVGLIYQLKASNVNSDERLKLIKQINDQYGTTLKNLSDETEFQQQLNLAINDYIELQRTKFQLGENQEKINKLLAREQELNKFIKRDYDEINDLAQRLNITFGEASRRLSLTDQEYRKNLKTLDGVKSRLLALGASTLDLNEKQNQLTDGGKKYEEQTKKNNKATDKQKEVTDKLTASLLAYYEAIESDRQKRITDDREKELQEAANRYDSLTALADAAGQDTTAITEQYQKDIQEINKKYNDLAKQSEQEKVNERRKINAELKVLEIELRMQEELNTVDTEEEKKKIRKKYADELKNARIAQIKTLTDIELANTKLTEEQRQKIISDSNLKIAELNEKSVDDTVKTTKEIVQKTLNEISQISSQVFGAINSLLGALSESMRLQQEQLAYQRDLQYQSEEAALENLLAQNLISREEYDAKTAEMNQQKAMEERAARRKAFNDEKKLRMASAGMAMAQAILNGLATQPLVPLGIIMAALAAVTGGIQLSNIKNQQFTAARGGVVPGSGPSHIDSVPSMLAPGEMVINSQSASMFPQTLSQINQMGGGIALTPDIPQKTTSGGNQKVYQENKEAQRVYVLETDITRSQKRVTRIEDIASF
jgi:hypothetical protein